MREVPSADLEHVLEHTPGVWDAIRGGRVFLTGGTGFFGCWLMESFAWANDRLGLQAEALVLTRDPARFARKAPHLAAHPAIRLISGDVRKFDPPRGPVRYVIHAATPSTAATLGDGDQLSVFDVALEGTRAALEAAVGWNVEGFLLTSSGAIYGRQPPALSHVPEDYLGGPDPMSPTAAYAEGKRAAEQLTVQFGRRHGLRTVVARGFAFAGPHLPLDAHFAVGNFIRDGLAGGPICVAGDGTPFRSYMYGADLAAWLWTLLVRGTAARAYNVGSPTAISIADLAMKIGGLLGAEVRTGRVATGGPAERYVPDVSRARDELGLQVRIGLDDALTRTIHWHRGS